MGNELIHFKHGVGGELCGCLGRQKAELKPETSPEAKMTKLKLPYFGHMKRRRGSLEKTIVLGK